MRLVFLVRVFSRVGRDAANEGDARPCLRVEGFVFVLFESSWFYVVGTFSGTSSAK